MSGEHGGLPPPTGGAAAARLIALLPVSTAGVPPAVSVGAAELVTTRAVAVGAAPAGVAFAPNATRVPSLLAANMPSAAAAAATSLYPFALVHTPKVVATPFASIAFHTPTAPPLTLTSSA